MGSPSKCRSLTKLVRVRVTWASRRVTNDHAQLVSTRMSRRRSWWRDYIAYNPHYRTYIQVPFLNLMAIIAARGGEVHIRVGGNTQETAVVVDSLPDGSGGIMQKDKENTSNPVRVSRPPSPRLPDHSSRTTETPLHPSACNMSI